MGEVEWPEQLKSWLFILCFLCVSTPCMTSICILCYVVYIVFTVHCIHITTLGFVLFIYNHTCYFPPPHSSPLIFLKTSILSPVRSKISSRYTFSEPWLRPSEKPRAERGEFKCARSLSGQWGDRRPSTTKDGPHTSEKQNVHCPFGKSTSALSALRDA